MSSQKQSLKQQILEEFKKRFFDSEISDIDGKTDYYLNDEAGEENLIDFLSSSLDKILEEAKGCRSRNEVLNILEGEQDDLDDHSYFYKIGFNKCLSEFDKNWKERIGE